MLPTRLARMSLREICELYSSGGLPEEYSKISLSELVNLADEEESAVLDSTAVGTTAVRTTAAGTTAAGTIEKKFTWREDTPNSNFTNVPLVLFRGDENNVKSQVLQDLVQSSSVHIAVQVATPV